jgi:hypothetical protein
MNSKINGEQAGAVACKRCHGSGSVEDGQITHHECGIPYENGPVQCMKDCPACNGAGKFFAAPGAAIAAREQEGETGDKPRGPRIEHLCRAICAHINVDPDAVLDYTDGKPSKLAWHRHDLQAARLLRELDSLASRQEAPAASHRPKVPLSVSVAISAYGDARADDDGTSAARLGECIREIRDALAAVASTAPEQSAKGLTMGGEVDGA